MYTLTIRWALLRTMQQCVHQQPETAPQADAATPDQRLIAIVIDETWTLLWSEEKAVAALPEAAPNSENSPLA